MPLAQRRHRERDDVEAEEQVGPELPRACAASMSRLVADTNLTFMARDRSAPTGRTSRASMTRSSLACMVSGISPISSRNTVPPLADSSRPILAPTAPVKAPRSCPKSSLSIRVCDSAGAVERQERLVGARRQLVDEARQHLLAHPRLAQDHHVDARRGGPHCHAAHALHAGQLERRRRRRRRPARLQLHQRVGAGDQRVDRVARRAGTRPARRCRRCRRRGRPRARDRSAAAPLWSWTRAAGSRSRAVRSRRRHAAAAGRGPGSGRSPSRARRRESARGPARRERRSRPRARTPPAAGPRSCRATRGGAAPWAAGPRAPRPWSCRWGSSRRADRRPLARLVSAVAHAGAVGAAHVLIIRTGPPPSGRSGSGRARATPADPRCAPALRRAAHRHHPGRGERLREERVRRHHQQVKSLAVRRRTIAIFRNRRFSYHGGPPLTVATISRPVQSIKRTGVTARGARRWLRAGAPGRSQIARPIPATCTD